MTSDCLSKITSHDVSLWSFGFNYPKYNRILSLLRDVLVDWTSFDGFSNLWIEMNYCQFNFVMHTILNNLWKVFCYRIIDFSADYKQFMFWLNGFALWFKSALSLRQLHKFITQNIWAYMAPIHDSLIIFFFHIFRWHIFKTKFYKM